MFWPQECQFGLGLDFFQSAVRCISLEFNHSILLIFSISNFYYLNKDKKYETCDSGLKWWTTHLLWIWTSANIISMSTANATAISTPSLPPPCATPREVCLSAVVMRLLFTLDWHNHSKYSASAITFPVCFSISFFKNYINRKQHERCFSIRS